MEYDMFIAKVRDAGSGSLIITIPLKLCQLNDINKGDLVKAMVCKAKAKV